MGEPRGCRFNPRRCPRSRASPGVLFERRLEPSCLLSAVRSPPPRGPMLSSAPLGTSYSTISLPPATISGARVVAKEPSARPRLPVNALKTHETLLRRRKKRQICRGTGPCPEERARCTRAGDRSLAQGDLLSGSLDSSSGPSSRAGGIFPCSRAFRNSNGA